jgi:hypothetical protein
MLKISVLLLAVLFLFGCGKSAKREQVKDSPEFQEYGKPGPGKGQACYVGDAKAAHTCTEAMNGDTESIKLLNSYCERFEGQRGSGTCKVEGHMGTCRYIPEALNLKLRYYGRTWDEARTACAAEGGQFFSTY